MFRKFLFWTHLAVGIVAAIGILIMAVTGVLITYEPQIENWANRKADPIIIPVDASRLTADQLFEEVQPKVEFSIARLTYSAHPEDYVAVNGAQRDQIIRVNPYTAEEVGPGSLATQKFFSVMIRTHRWLNLDGDARVIGLEFLSASNFAAMFLVLSGIYLWFPQVMRWALFRDRMWFKGAKTSKARDFHWHHVFGFLSLIPLAVIIFSGLKISYDWPDKLVYMLTGDEPPARVVRAAEPTPAATLPDANNTSLTQELQPTVETVRYTTSLEDHLMAVSKLYPDWQKISISIPKPADASVMATVERGNRRQPHLEHTLTLDRETLEPLKIHSFSDETAAQRTLDLMLPLHTGEVFGFWGQTLALLSCIALGILVWTGVALSWRRLIQKR